MIDFTDPSVKMEVRNRVREKCCACDEMECQELCLRVGTHMKKVGAICYAHQTQLVAIRQSRRRDKYGVNTQVKGLGRSAPRMRFHESLSPSFVSAGRALFHLTAAQQRKRKKESA